MPKRRLTLHREELTSLDSDQMSSVAGAISGLHPACLLSIYQTCPNASCAHHCTFRCPTDPCAVTETCQ